MRRFSVGLLQVLGFAGEGIIDRCFEVGHLRERAHGDLMLFDVMPDRLDARLLRAM